MTAAEDKRAKSVTDSTDFAGSDLAVRLQAFFAVLFLVGGTAFLVAAYVGIAWPAATEVEVVGEYVAYGRSLPMALNLLVFGWLTFGLMAVLYYFVPRLLGTRLALRRVAAFNALMMAGGVLTGVVAIGNGSGSGGRLLEMPWYSDAVLTTSFLVAAVVVTRTITRSDVERVGVPVWYFLAAPWWLFLSFAIGAVPGLGGAPAELQSAFTATAIFGMWIASAAVGGGYALVARLVPGAGFHPRLGRIGFWSLGLLWAWTAARTLQYSPMGDWMETVPVLFSSALIVAVLAISADFALALRGRWDAVTNSMPLQLFAAGMALLVLLPGSMLVQSLRSVSAVVRFTAWESAFDLLALMGVFSLLTVALLAHVLASQSGHAWKPRTGTVVGVPLAGGVLFAVGTRWIAGLQQGYTWVAGVETGDFENVGGDFFNTIGPLHGTDVLTVIGLAVAAVGVLVFVLGASLRLGGSGSDPSFDEITWHDDERPLVLWRGAVAVFALTVLAVFVFPAIDADRDPTLLADASRDFADGSIDSDGRAIYVAEGCVYCHTQQVRAIVTDVGLGPVSVSGDYAYDPAGIFGVARIGPDLAHAGSRSPTNDPAWVRAHLSDPRLARPWSTMPSYAHLTDAELTALAAYVAGLE